MRTTADIDYTGQRPELAQLLTSVQGVTALPQVTRRIIDLVEDPGSTPRQLHEIVLHDPALTARLLKVVNSAFYGAPRRIASIERAILVLGARGVKSVAIAASLGAMWDGAAICEGFVGRDLWAHSIAVAVAARDLARTTELAPADEAFLAALIHDIGLLVVAQARPGELQAVCDLARADGGDRDFCALERQTIGFDHQDLGMGLAARWRLPRTCQLAAGHHHQPRAAAADWNRPLLMLVHVADTLCGHRGYGFNLTALHQAPLNAERLAEMGVDPLAVSQTRDRLDGLVAEAVSLLG
jgi:HD-like signal output (HDOD) protein